MVERPKLVLVPGYREVRKELEMLLMGGADVDVVDECFFIIFVIKNINKRNFTRHESPHKTKKP